jgi:ribosomal-protein-alanine N-acetyltransferase
MDAARGAAWTLERIVSEKDLDEIIELDRASFTRPWTPAMFLEAVRSLQDCRVYACRRKGETRLAGFVCYRLSGPTLQIATVAVRASLRGQGLGSMLVRFALDEGAQAGARHAILDVRVSNHAARRVYERLGFVPVAVHPKYYDAPVEDGLTYSRSICPIEPSRPASSLTTTPRVNT